VHPFHQRLARIGLAAADTGEDLLRLAAEHDPGFDRDMFADALRAVRRFARSAFEPYGLSEPDIDRLHRRLLDWADEISGRRG
jgi:hypothetical protein